MNSEQMLSPAENNYMEEEEEDEQSSADIIVEEIKKEFRSVKSIA